MTKHIAHIELTPTEEDKLAKQLWSCYGPVHPSWEFGDKYHAMSCSHDPSPTPYDVHITLDPENIKKGDVVIESTGIGKLIHHDFSFGYRDAMSNDERDTLKRCRKVFASTNPDIKAKVWHGISEYYIQRYFTSWTSLSAHKIVVLHDEEKNTVAIKEYNTFYKRDEVETLLYNYADNNALLSSKQDIAIFNEWMKNNLD